MERVKYFNDTKPTETQLNHTEDSRARAILRRARANCQFGIVSGFIVRPNPAAGTHIDIGPGEAYTGGKFVQLEADSDGSGERIASEGYAAQYQALVDYTLGVDNYISLVYTETESTPLAERYYPFATHNTIVAESFSVSVLTETDWNALSLVEKSSRVLVAIVTAQGAGNPVTLANITQLQQPKNHPTAANPSTLTGITVDSLAQTTLLGTGTLRWDVAAAQLFWTAPFDAEGAGVTIGSSGEYTLYSNDTTYYLIVFVVFASLPGANVTETIAITSVYGREIPIACSVDTAHRDMIGSSQPTLTNPHGLSWTDIHGGSLEHADLFHVNGISKDALATQLQCAINLTNIEINNIGGYRNQFLIDGNTYEFVDGYAAGAPGIVAFPPATASGEYLVYLDSVGAANRVLLGHNAGAVAGSSFWTANIELWDMQNTVGGAGNLTWSTADYTLTWTAPGDGAGTPVKVTANGATIAEGYYKLYSSDVNNWIIVRVLGDLGVAVPAWALNGIALDETSIPHDSILKLCVAHWTVAGPLENVRDIRRFNTADNREELEEEHDKYGRHIKVLQQTFRVGVQDSYAIDVTAESSYAIRAIARDGNTGIYGQAAATGIYGYAVGNVGVRGYAGGVIGVFASAVAGTGLYAEAGNKGVYAYANAGNTGVYGEAVGNIGVQGYAGVNTGIYGFAAGDIGVKGQADNTGVWGSVAGATGVYGQAAATGVRGYAGGNIEVIGHAAGNTGVYGFAEADTGVYGEADNVGVYGSAAVANGVRGYAANYAVFGTAGVNTGVYGRAAADYGVYGTADASYGVYGIAGANCGVYGKADVDYGVYAWAVRSYGLYAKAGNVGAKIVATNGGAGLNNINLWLADGTMEYAVAPIGAGAVESYLPIIVDYGGGPVIKCIAIYATA